MGEGRGRVSLKDEVLFWTVSLSFLYYYLFMRPPFSSHYRLEGMAISPLSCRNISPSRFLSENPWSRVGFEI
jgi:hypothetical protein